MRRSKHLISDFREVIELYTYTTTTDTTGGTKPSYVKNTTTLAKVEPFDGDLFIEGGERVINNKYIFTIRFRSALTWDGVDDVWDKVLTQWSENTQNIDKRYKIKYRNDFYIIHSVRLDDEMRYFIKIVAWRRK